MTGRREKILTHLETTTLVAAATALTTALGKTVLVYRNRSDIEPYNPETKEAQLPALILLDNKETPLIETRGKGRPGQLSPTIMRMEPQVYCALMPRETSENEGVGPELSTFRDQVLASVGTDMQLWALLGSSGDMTYDGLDSDMHADGPMVGQQAVKFSMYYTFNPNEA